MDVELLAPAGNLNKLRIAFAHGADACYVGIPIFGLRKFADNLSMHELHHAVELANEYNKKVYVVLNGFAHNSDIRSLITQFEQLERIQPHAFIISDMGVLQCAKTHTSIPIHTSTQASVTNHYGAKLWKDAGANRIILAREVSISDCKAINDHVDIELEVFVHGSMCASYSGKCVISNYTSGRDSNRGGCIQSCRHKYDIMTNGSVDYSSHVMNAKDLNAIDLIPDMINAGIASFKIEGRMKSPLYLANTVSIYRNAIDQALDKMPSIVSEKDHLHHVSNRGFSTGGLVNRPFAESIAYTFNAYQKSVNFIGSVKSVSSENECIAEIKAPLHIGDSITLILPEEKKHSITISSMKNMIGASIQHAKQNSLIRLPSIHPMKWKPHTVLETPISKIPTR